MRKSEKLDPHYAEFIHALRNVGYSFEEAVADVIDNSIDAAATQVQLRFVVRKSGAVDLLTVDNGRGMSAEELREAMRFGSQVRKEKARLGMFGLGLKLASIAHASTLLVVSLQRGRLSGRAWTDEGLRQGFFCEILEPDEIETICAFSRLPRRSGSGTWVYWDNLFRFSSRFSHPQELCEELTSGLRSYLGLHLHRFLDRLDITIDIYDEVAEDYGVSRSVPKLDPFGYDGSGAPGYPLRLLPPAPYDRMLTIRAHVWPPKSSRPEYKLPGGSNRRQGLYFYRNGRLLSGGTWHGIRDEDPHSSLARVEIDLAVDVEREASVDVRKAMVKLTPELRRAIAESTSKNGIDFTQFLNRANAAYRRGESHDPKNLPLIPASGYPRELSKQLMKLLDKGNTGRSRRMEFVWTDLGKESADFFRIDRDNLRILLNERFRKLFRQGERTSPVDAALVKTLLFVLLGRSVQIERITAKQEAWLEELNRMLALAGSYEIDRTS